MPVFEVHLKELKVGNAFPGSRFPGIPVIIRSRIPGNRTASFPAKIRRRVGRGAITAMRMADTAAVSD